MKKINHIAMMEQMIEALKKQVVDLEAQKSTMERQRLSFDLLHRYTVEVLKRKNKSLLEVVSSLDNQLMAAKARPFVYFEESGEITQIVCDEITVERLNDKLIVRILSKKER